MAVASKNPVVSVPANSGHCVDHLVPFVLIPFGPWAVCLPRIGMLNFEGSIRFAKQMHSPKLVIFSQGFCFDAIIRLWILLARVASAFSALLRDMRLNFARGRKGKEIIFKTPTQAIAV